VLNVLDRFLMHLIDDWEQKLSQVHKKICNGSIQVEDGARISNHNIAVGTVPVIVQISKEEALIFMFPVIRVEGFEVTLFKPQETNM